MFKPLIAGLTALSLTFATVTPATAGGLDQEDVGKIIIGIAAIAALNAAIENSRDGSDRSVQTQVHDRHNTWSDLARPRSRHSDPRRVLPSECLRQVETRFGTQRIFGQRCLARNYRHASRLPDRCEVRLYTTNGPLSGFDPFCLRDEGFRTTRRH